MNITIHKDGKKLGPFPAGRVAEMLHAGELSPNDLAWSQGMAEWKPLAGFPGLPAPAGAAIPPIPGSPTPLASPKKNEPLGIWSLVLGILSLLGCSVGGFLLGIPAVICGHIGLSKINRNPALGGRGMAITGLVTGYLGLLTLPILAALALPAISGALERGKATRMMMNMKQIFLVTEAARLDGDTTGATGLGFPFDAKIKTKADFKKMLLDYITAEDLERMGFDMIEIGNVSASDPDSTIFLKANSKNTLVIFGKSGLGQLFRQGQPNPFTDPPRNPPYLD